MYIESFSFSVYRCYIQTFMYVKTILIMYMFLDNLLTTKFMVGKKFIVSAVDLFVI